MNKSAKKAAPLPSKDQILAYVRESPGRLNKREIARAFGLKGEQRIELKRMLRELAEEGLITRGRGKQVLSGSGLPRVTVLEITGTDADGELMARPASWRGEAAPPTIYVVPERGRRPAVAEGEKVLARLKAAGDGTYEARVMKRLARAPGRVLGQYRLGPDGGRVEPTDRRMRHDFLIGKGDAGGARPGELVLVEPLHEARQRARPLGPRPARIVERLGDLDAPRSISLIAIHAHDIPTEFSGEALADARAAKPVALGERSDLRDLPLVTIDGADARDFDDAVWAEPDDDPANPGGWHAVVAIADVAHYVRPRGALDRAAHERGNSVYFPDRVVPMLPEALSNDLCSLRPGEDRPCLAAHLWIGADGSLRRHRFERGLMRSAARLTYSQVQAARDGQPDEQTGPLLAPVLAPLYGALDSLLAARRKRGALDIELPEHRVMLADDGTVERIALRERLDSHRLIEELMITANVAAAETLERLGQPCMYRVHEAPDPLKIQAVGEVLAELGYRLPKSPAVKPGQFNRILDQSRGATHERLVNEIILRCQSQAVYSPDNLGHFGLALRRYAHFTSPIRRYSDLLVHRALIGGLKLGPDGTGPFQEAAEAARFGATGTHISNTERRAMAAERDAMDRYLAAHLSDRIGGQFSGRINGVSRFGLFVTLAESGADGLVPVRSLPIDYYEHDEAQHRLTGRERRLSFTLGDEVEVRLVEAKPLTGGLVLELLSGGTELPPGRGRLRRRPGPGPRRRRR
ncbi:MAG: ribonuclease R [Alphaproteobacteria bacterium]|nr:ribonuclease R [Alphaproteobacteria bacterium]